MKLRSYQQAAVDEVYEHLRSRDDNPVTVMPTGAGKSLVLAATNNATNLQTSPPTPLNFSTNAAIF